eukprot:Partr_v1_DN26872_c0_g1_i3_m40406 putative TBC1 domain family member
MQSKANLDDTSDKDKDKPKFEELSIGQLSIAIAAPVFPPPSSSPSSHLQLVQTGNKTLVQRPGQSGVSYTSSFYQLTGSAASTSALPSSSPYQLPPTYHRLTSSAVTFSSHLQMSPPPGSKLQSTNSPVRRKQSSGLHFVDSTNSDWFDEEDEIASPAPAAQSASVSTSTEVSPAAIVSPVVLAAVDVPVSGSPSRTSSAGGIDGRVLPNAPRSEHAVVIATTKPTIHQAKDITHSPGSSMNRSSHSKKDDDWVVVPGGKVVTASSSATSLVDHASAEILEINSKIARIEKFHRLITRDNIDLEQLRKHSWNGIPENFRPVTWKLLMGYMPSNFERRENTLSKKRRDYKQYIAETFGKGNSSLDQTIWHQICIDIPRTNPAIKLYQSTRVQKALERLLYCWAIRHPASGYVQGINDLATPFFQVFLSEYLDKQADVENCNIQDIANDALDCVEADTFWCLSKLLDGIQDNYTHAQPGILRQIQKMTELIGRIDAKLLEHLQGQNIDFIQFAFRWMNCLLMREMTMNNVIRMWDTYLAEGPDGFSDFHIYVCAAFLSKWSEHLRGLEFQDLIMFLQNLPTKDWKEKEVEILLSEAFMWKSLYHDSPSHLKRRT